MNLKPPSDPKLAQQVERNWNRIAEDASRVYYARPVLQMSDHAVRFREERAAYVRRQAEADQREAERQAQIKARDAAVLRILREDLTRGGWR